MSMERAQPNKNYHKTFVVWSLRTGDDDMTVAVTMTNDEDINNTDNDNIGEDRIHIGHTKYEHPHLQTIKPTLQGEPDSLYLCNCRGTQAGTE